MQNNLERILVVNRCVMHASVLRIQPITRSRLNKTKSMVEAKNLSMG